MDKMNEILPQTLINDGIVSEQTLIMVLMLPVVGTILGFARHIIGIKSLGLYAPIILTYAFFELGLTSSSNSWSSKVIHGLKYGIILTAIVFISTYLAHEITRKLRLHYFPKVALVLSVVAVFIYAAILIASWTDKEGFLTIRFLPVILIATVSEQFVSMMSKKNSKTALSLAATTLLIAAMTFGLIIYEPFQDLLIKYPYLIFITVLINILIGRFTGLRVLEYFRFRDILNKED